MVKMLAKSAGKTATEDTIRETKLNLLEANRAYFRRLIQLGSDIPVTEPYRELLGNIELLANRQLALLDSYTSSKCLR